MGAGPEGIINAFLASTASKHVTSANAISIIAVLSILLVTIPFTKKVTQLPSSGNVSKTDAVPLSVSPMLEKISFDIDAGLRSSTGNQPGKFLLPTESA